MNLKTTCIFTLILLVFSLGKSQNLEKISVTIEAGTHAYFGDLSYKLKASERDPSYRLSLGYQISPAFALSLGYQSGNVYGNDFLITNHGKELENENFTRALNFKSALRTVNLLAQYHFDNGKVLKEGSLFAPFLFIGVGLTSFKSYGDLYYGENNDQRYFYWSDNTIRDLPEGDFIGEIIAQDGDYETELTNLGTESDGPYPASFLQVPVGAGVKVNLSPRFSLNASLTAHLLFSDYLDDVSGDYRNSFDNPTQAYAANPSANLGIRPTRGNPNNKNDFLVTPSIGVTFRFGKKEKPIGSVKTTKKVDPFFAGKGDENRLAPIVTTRRIATFNGRDTVYILKTDTLYQSVTGKTIRSDAGRTRIENFENQVLDGEFSEEMNQLKKEIAQLKSLYKKAGGTLENTLEMAKLEQELKELEIQNNQTIDAQLTSTTTSSVSGPRTRITAEPPKDVVEAKAKSAPAQERIAKMRTSVPPVSQGSEAAALQGLFEQLAFLNDEIEKLKGKNERFEDLLLKVDQNKDAVSPMASVTSVDGGLGLIFPTLHKERIYFRTGQEFLSPSQRQHLDGIVPVLQRYPNLGIIITGHTDKAGNPVSNMELSRRRAESVKNYFLSKASIQEYQVMTNFFGPSIPSQEIQGNSTVSQFDRRVEIDYLKVR